MRKVMNPPIIKGFKPYGPETGKHKIELVNLLYEEYEALRLSDYDMLNHHQASIKMAVSRPTFTRIYASALQKIAKAFVEGRQISIEGGKVYFDSDWYYCNDCGCHFNNPEKEKSTKDCPLCGSNKITAFASENSMENNPDNLCGDLCICLNCGLEQKHQSGIPCSQEICPKCNISMKRKRNLNCINS
ncbi:MAG: DUF134 domain-containing protein [Bacteroidetes bacterium]|nr:DUF134 domain-containing protein [Bacteroidota bacterium]MBU1717871.1 DUF134 domain-containing protein [Bacteroidota bacterium]